MVIINPTEANQIFIMGEREPALLHKIHICLECMYTKPLGLILAGIASMEREGDINGQATQP